MAFQATVDDDGSVGDARSGCGGGEVLVSIGWPASSTGLAHGSSEEVGMEHTGDAVLASAV